MAVQRLKTGGRGIPGNQNSEVLFRIIYILALTVSLSLNFLFVSKETDVSIDIPQSLEYIKSFQNFLPYRAEEGKSDKTFSACLLIMDDNHRMTEWLAYHYHVLPLDYLVVAVDPNSKTSPAQILDQWRGYGMTIIEWNNTDIFNGMLWEYNNIVLKRQRRPHDHRQRQNMFVRNCLAHMKEANRTWVLLVDSDEYLLFNGPPGTNKNFAKVTYPTIKKESSVLDFLNREGMKPETGLSSPCISIPRMLFGAVESKEEQIRNKVPSGFDPVVFDTLRYRKHIKREVTHHHPVNGWSKSIIDVSRVNWSDFPTVKDAFRTTPWQMNIHQPLPKVCPRPYIKNNETLFRINHYVGSWEAFSYRQDARAKEGRDKSKWQAKADRVDETDDNIRAWLGGFVGKHGREKASEMLRQVGVFTEIEWSK